MPQRNIDEREERKQYVHRRQVKVFTFVAAVLAVALIVSVLFELHGFSGKAQTSPSEQADTNFGAASVCAPLNEHRNEAAYPSNSTVYVRVLNGTKSRGFAGAVGEALTDRLFNVTSVSNYTRQNVKRTTIYYGVNNIYQAYTVLANFSDAQMVMDNRQDALVDVVLGTSFNDLVSKKQIPAKNAKIKNLKGCTNLDKVDKAKLPSAPVHDAPPAPAEGDQNS
ncbi:LytR C-terminal domain-containing protein [Bifidobacterium bombi]|uniref:LytR/CpsA/Psr regulator C-terminal domain-containing protein n=1 Tax=Bifidobacterium bombi DSM 19703 TaxID=1341695 RepID=A0A086BPK7_9BIFI|nr:LytR C-terminal domain-containing protein [Bifidobacterium bombi]KFF31871.1 hypothetical protein BBOMB_1280 [Bifidobacterium bombi DSM 19703]